ncbi:hypothetical protein FOMPIDRAFT_1022909 [Fomitopsis schrenkii]|uniref:Uncharacterized protein n=1 Tax=Fomitopsis schrenkii TaxID=2126942 RepID=S8EBG5_FOMSC|nr:hypothetical protein FOMPIDRAFT_1022909 [Fomitopsis schrenkii]
MKPAIERFTLCAERPYDRMHLGFSESIFRSCEGRPEDSDRRAALAALGTRKRYIRRGKECCPFRLKDEMAPTTPLASSPS